MADLESAAIEAQGALRSLTSQVEQAKERFGSLARGMEGVEAGVDGAWSKLTEQASAFLDAVRDEQARLAAESRDAGQALATLGAAVDQRRGEARAEVEQTRQQIAGFREGVDGREPSLRALAGQVLAASEALVRQADDTARSLQDALGQAHDSLVEQVANGLRALQDEVRSRGELLTAAFEEWADELRSSYDDWAAGLDTVEQTVAEAFREAGENLAENVESSLEVYSGEYVSAVGGVVQRVAEVEKLLQQLEAATTTCGGDATEAATELTQGLQATGQAADAVRAKLGEIKALLASYTFVQ